MACCVLRFFGKLAALTQVVSKLQVNLWSAPVLQPLTLDAVLACPNLSGVVVRKAPRATMKFAPAVPIKLCGFRSLFTCRGVPQAGVPFTSSGFSRRKSRGGNAWPALVQAECLANSESKVLWRATMAHAVRASLL